MLFDLAMTFLKRRQIKDAVLAVSTEDWPSLAELMSKGLSPNQRLPVESLPGINHQGARSTTPFLAMSMHRMNNPPENANQKNLLHAFAVALETGADLSVRAEGDARSAIDHQANIRSLGGWQVISALRPLDFPSMIDQAISFDWQEGESFARTTQAYSQFSDLDHAAPPSQSRPGPRL